MTFPNSEEVETFLLSLAAQGKHLSQESQDAYFASGAPSMAQLHAHFQTVMDHFPAYVAYMDAKQRLWFMNKSFKQLFCAEEHFHGKTQLQILGEELYRPQCSSIEMALEGEKISFEQELLDPVSSEQIHLKVDLIPHVNPQNKVVGFYFVAYDISELKHFESLVSWQKDLAYITLQTIGDGVLITNHKGLITYCNLKMEQLLGKKAEDIRGHLAEDLFSLVNSLSRVPLPNPIRQTFEEKTVIQLEGQTLLVSKDGQEQAIEGVASPILRQGELLGTVLVLHDVTKSNQILKQLSYQATHDPLTGLINRTEFERAVETLVKLTASTQQTHALLYIDLDQFKVINDTCGHLAGDELLQHIAQLLLTQLRRQDVLARLGGDEFGILLTDCSLSESQEIAASLIQRIQEFRFIWKTNPFSLSTSIGLVEINQNTVDFRSLLSAADTACFIAKDMGRNRVKLFTHEDSVIQAHHTEMNWVSQITTGFDENRFLLYYQNIVPTKNPKSDQGAHFEILLRMRDHHGNLVPPATFISAAERYNLMPSIDRWVIRTLFSNYSAHFRKMNALYPGNCLYSINLSGTSINDERFLQFVIDQFALYQPPPETICFEITETAAIANFSRASHLIKTLRQMGCKFALDDFGAGLSSFAYLKNLPVDFLKIDGMFVKDLGKDPVNYAMVEAISRIATVMELKTIAEFVENDTILHHLQQIGVNYAQGYGIHKPEPLNLAPKD